MRTLVLVCQIVFFSFLLYSCTTTAHYQKYNKAIEELTKQYANNIDTASSVIQVTGVVKVDSFFIHYNRNIDPDKLWKYNIFKTKSDVLYFSTTPCDVIDCGAHQKLFKECIFDSTSFVIISSSDFLRKHIIPFVKDTMLKENLRVIVDNDDILPIGVVNYKRIFFKHNKYACDVAFYKTNCFLRVQMPVWFFNLTYSKHSCPPIFYFLGEEEYYDLYLNVIVPLPADIQDI